MGSSVPGARHHSASRSRGPVEFPRTMLGDQLHCLWTTSRITGVCGGKPDEAVGLTYVNVGKPRCFNTRESRADTIHQGIVGILCAGAAGFYVEHGGGQCPASSIFKFWHHRPRPVYACAISAISGGEVPSASTSEGHVIELFTMCGRRRSWRQGGGKALRKGGVRRWPRPGRVWKPAHRLRPAGTGTTMGRSRFGAGSARWR